MNLMSCPSPDSPRCIGFLSASIKAVNICPFAATRPESPPSYAVIIATGEILHDDRLRAPIEAIAKKHGKTVAQTAIRWCLQRGIGCIPKSTKPSRVVENVDVFAFELDSDDIQKIDSLAKVAYVKATWEPREMSRYQGVISRNIDKFHVHQID